MSGHHCCSPSAEPRSPSGAEVVLAHSREAPGAGMVVLQGGEFLMGSEDRFAYPDDGEGPVRRARVEPFRVDTRAVSNADFARFVEETAYVTEAERFGWSFVFGGLLPDDFPPTQGVAQAPWWRRVEAATWSRPEGPGSDLDGRGNHPVVHVSWNDAQSYSAWAGKRLPSEAEWEYSARGGLETKVYPWGDELEPAGEHRMNVWQGSFPNDNSCADGFYGTCPVDAFPANGYGLYNTTGNIWEWCSDLFRSDLRNRSTRGGSYLCHHSYCRRYRVSARNSLTPDSSTGNTGFRCVADA